MKQKSIILFLLLVFALQNISVLCLRLSQNDGEALTHDQKSKTPQAPTDKAKDPKAPQAPTDKSKESEKPKDSNTSQASTDKPKDPKAPQAPSDKPKQAQKSKEVKKPQAPTEKSKQTKKGQKVSAGEKPDQKSKQTNVIGIKPHEIPKQQFEKHKPIIGGKKYKFQKPFTLVCYYKDSPQKVFRFDKCKDEQSCSQIISWYRNCQGKVNKFS